MASLILNNLIRLFIESLSSEKGYSANTSRAYLHDLNEFVSFIINKRFSGKENQQDKDKLRVDEVESLMIRGYLGYLHKRNK